MNVIKQINEKGLVPANHACPFLKSFKYVKGCPKWMCLHESNNRSIDFSCGIARAFAICSDKGE